MISTTTSTASAKPIPPTGSPWRRAPWGIPLAALFVFSMPTGAAAEDVVEFLSGARVQGEVTKIDREAQKISFEANIGGRKFARIYTYAKIHAVVYQGRRFVLNEKEVASTTPATGASNRVPTDPAQPAAANPEDSPAGGKTTRRSVAEIKTLIATAGKTPPDWYDATPLNYPQTLDLSWAKPANKAWDPSKNIGQFMWTTINENPSRWREGARFLHFMVGHTKGDATLQARSMNELGRVYFELLQDYPRAAFWYEQAGVGRGGQFDSSKNGAHLAECYWRLGSKQMAETLLGKMPHTYASIKLWGDMGETQKAVLLGNAALKSAKNPASAYLMIGDAYRVVGDYDKAEQAYTAAFAASNNGKDQRLNGRAVAGLEAIKYGKGLDVKRVADGIYKASNKGYEDQVHIEVRVATGRIEELRVTQHREKQFYSSIEDTPQKIIERQGIQGVDTTSGATITSEAIIAATAKALSGG